MSKVVLSIASTAIFLFFLTGCTLNLPFSTSITISRNTNSAVNQESQSFHGYPCKADCSRHKAGYAWAEQQGIKIITDCIGENESFIEGCKAYVERGK